MGMTERPSYSWRADPAVASFDDNRPIIVFDGVCVLCTGWARFALRHDRAGRFRFLPAQSDLGRALYRHFGLDPENYETNILLDGGFAFFESEACIRMAEGLGAPWSAASILRLLPLRLRDWMYKSLARNRLRVFGTRVACYLPEPHQRERFLA
jgi:predicted DCC family thiol-disulfide oxidoreductase YuxK